MFLRFIATFFVTLFFILGNTIKEVPQRILQPKSSYIYDSSTMSGEYVCSRPDTPLNHIFNVDGNTLASLNPNNYVTSYLGIATIFSEGITDYYLTSSSVSSTAYSVLNGFPQFLYSHYPSTDFFTLDIYRFYYYQSQYYIVAQARYYGIGEQKLGALSYFEDNSAFSTVSEGNSPSAYFCVDVLNYTELFFGLVDTPPSSLANANILITNDNKDIYFKRLYTETKPNLLSFGGANKINNDLASLSCEAYIYPFHFEYYFGGTLGTPFTYLPYDVTYNLTFGFTHANSENSYDKGYADGYQVGYDEGSDVADSQLNDKYNEGVADGYDEGYDDAYDDYYDSRYTQGYNDGRYDESQLSNKYTFSNLFGALADTPIMILRSLLGFDVFGVNAMTILMSMVTACIALFVIRKII